MKGKVVAIVLARGGSKGIPRKNVLNFCGYPLVAWSIIQAKIAHEIDEIYLSSDSEEILGIGQKFGAKSIVRPDFLATDSAKSEDAMIHALSCINDKLDIVIMLEPTAPLRDPNDLSNAIKMFKKEK